MPVLVLGMHRSGTSLVTRAVNLLGVDIENPAELMAPSEDNERGYWEPRRLAEINDRLLESWGGSWCAPPIDEAPPPPAPSLFEKMTALVGSRRETGRSWVWKDPRMCVTAPAWRDCLGTPVCLLVVRNPRDVWLSLYRRDAFPRHAAYLLWEIHMRRAIAFAAGAPSLVVRYEDLVASPPAEIARIDEFLERSGVVRTEADREAAEAECVSSLRHNESDEDAFLADPVATPSQVALHEGLLRAVGGEAPKLPKGPSTDPVRMVEVLASLDQMRRRHEARELDGQRYLALDRRLYELGTSLDRAVGEVVRLSKRLDYLERKVGAVRRELSPRGR